mgnify:CR=1 FL=1
MIELKGIEDEEEKENGMSLRHGEEVFTVDEAIEHAKFGKYQIYLICFVGSIWSTSTLFSFFANYDGQKTKHKNSRRCYGNYAHEFSVAIIAMSMESKFFRGSLHFHFRLCRYASGRTVLGIRR